LVRRIDVEVGWEPPIRVVANHSPRNGTDQLPGLIDDGNPKSSGTEHPPEHRHRHVATTGLDRGNGCLTHADSIGQVTLAQVTTSPGSDDEARDVEVLALSSPSSHETHLLGCPRRTLAVGTDSASGGWPAESPRWSVRSRSATH
jgi:hypothetical protein